jgi:lambda family phage portal protein
MQTSFRIGGQNVTVKENVIDRLVSYLSPTRGQQRFRARASMAIIGGYSGGSRRRRSLKGWNVTSNDADSDLLPDLAMLRERSRDLVRNTPIAAGAINTPVTNVVGGGLKLHSMIDQDYLGMEEAEADAWEAAAEREFNLWAGNPIHCDAAATLNFYGHTEMALRSTLENGDIFYLLPHIKRTGSPYLVKLKAIEADRVTNENNKRDTTKVAGGIQLDDNGAPSHYHIMQSHPGAMVRTGKKWDVIPAFGAKSGRRNVLHLFEQRRPGQRRGVPYLAPVIESLKQLGRYTDAELMAAVVSGMFTVFVHTDSDDPLTNDDGTAVNSDADLELGNGKIIALSGDDKIEIADPRRPNASFDPFVMSILRQIGAALEIPYELLIKHFTASYSASRAAIMEAWKLFKKRRAWLSDYFCNPVYEAVITEAVLAGRLVAPGFMDDVRIRAAYLGAEWVGPGKGQIQEKQEVEAAALRVKHNFSTEAKETAEMNGGNWTRNHRQRVKENKANVEDGLAESIVEPSPAPLIDPEE